MTETAGGVLKLVTRGAGVLRDPARSFRPGPDDPRVPDRLVRSYELPEGAAITGSVQRRQSGLELQSVTTIGRLTPEAFAKRRRFRDLVAIDPRERFPLAAGGDFAMRIVDLIAPIGKGTRGLIVSPPKAGKTTLLISFAQAIRAADPAADIIALLIDERPEEVTYFRRNVEAQVLASSKDQSPAEHVELAELTLAHVRTELECGRNIVVLIDSLTRMGRAFNVQGSATGRTMSGGLEAGVLEIPRRFFGLARNVEGGGSVTIIATVLIGTGSRMDELIFQEFKGTGNSEIVLDRSLSEARVFPAIDLTQSGTRKEELLYAPAEQPRIAMIRRALARRSPASAMRVLIKSIAAHPTNEDFLKSVPLG